MNTNLKICNKCFISQPLENFYRRNNYIDVYYHQCRTCISTSHKKYRSDNPEKVKEMESKRNKDINRRYVHAKYEASRPRRKKEWNITIEQYTTLMYQPCHYCNNKLHNKQNDYGVGLDRIDNSKGYIMDNVLPCCYICNRIRGEILTVEETKKLISLLLEMRQL